MSQPHAELVDAASRGDAAAVDALLERHLPGLLAYVRLHAGPLIQARESCSDLAQSVCREVLCDAHKVEYRGEAQFRKWLFKVAMSKIIDRQRFYLAQRRDPAREQRIEAQAGQVMQEALASFCTPSNVAIADEDMRRIERVFAQLPEDYRRVITLSRIVGCSHAEIAAEMDRKEGAVRMLLSRALSRFGYLLSQQA